jgi:hypothetical protein
MNNDEQSTNPSAFNGPGLGSAHFGGSLLPNDGWQNMEGIDMHDIVPFPGFLDETRNQGRAGDSFILAPGLSDPGVIIHPLEDTFAGAFDWSWEQMLDETQIAHVQDGVFNRTDSMLQSISSGGFVPDPSLGPGQSRTDSQAFSFLIQERYEDPGSQPMSQGTGPTQDWLNVDFSAGQPQQFAHSSLDSDSSSAGVMNGNLWLPTNVLEASMQATPPVTFRVNAQKNGNGLIRRYDRACVQSQDSERPAKMLCK